MKRKSNLAALQFFKKPAVMHMIAAFAGLSLLLLSFVLLLLPQQQKVKAIDREIEDAERQKSIIEGYPIPRKVSDTDVQKLLEQLPTKEETARLLQLIRQTAEQTQITVTSILFGDQKNNPQSSLEQMITNASQAQQASPAPSAAPQSSPAPGPAAKGGALFEESIVQLELSGMYSHVMDFINRLTNGTRIIQLLDWSLTPLGEAAINESNPKISNFLLLPASTPSQKGEMPVKMKIRAAAYIAPQYAGKLPDLPPIQAIPGAQRKDPTWTDEMMRELLKQDQPNR